MPEIATPNQGITTINRVVLELRKYSQPVTYLDIFEEMDLNAPATSQALSASRDAGLTKSGGKRGTYVLTSYGRDYAINLSYGRHDDAKFDLKKALIENKKWREILNYIESQGELSFDPFDLVRVVEMKLGKKWSNAMRNKIKSAYSSILVAAGIVEIREGMMISSLRTSFEDLSASFDVSQKSSQERDNAKKENGFARLETNDFKFEIKKDANVIEFAINQFNIWIEYVKKTIERQSD